MSIDRYKSYLCQLPEVIAMKKNGVPDLQIDEGTILVRDGKGEKDRITVLPVQRSSSLYGGTAWI